MRNLRISAATVVLWCGTPSMGGQFGFQQLDPSLMAPQVISRDGHVIIGNSNGGAVRSVDFGPLVAMPPPAGADNFYPRALSANGSVVVGYGIFLGQSRAMRWMPTGGTRILIPIGDFSIGIATAVSGDGNVIAGNDSNRAFRWTKTEGAQALPISLDAPYFQPRECNAVSENGNVIGGSTYAYPSVPFLWGAGVTVPLLSVSGVSAVLGMNESGTVAVGFDAGAARALRWENGVASALSTSGRAVAVSEDGKVVVGDSGAKLLLWTPRTGTVSLADVMVCHGVFEVANWTNWVVTSITADGRRIVGYANRQFVGQRGWMIELPACPADLNGDGFVDDSDFTLFVVSYDIYLDTAGDLNYDCVTDDADFSHFVVDYNELLCP